MTETTATVTADQVRAFLLDGEDNGARKAEFLTWVDELEELGPPPVPVPQATEARLRALLSDRLAVHPEDAEEIVATRPDPSRTPELWWLLERTHHQLIAGMGQVDGPRWSAPHLPVRLGADGRFFYVHVCLASLPAARVYHRDREVPDDISWETFADLGRQIAIYRRINGCGGLDVQFWFGLHFRGLIYSFGRLQFNRGKGWKANTATPFGPDDFVLGAHIPESGPMTPEACDESFARAKAFYARHFPEEGYRYATCGSWLLDDQLAAFLPADSNIIRFQRRFTPIPGAGWDGDDDVFQFVFRAKHPRLEDLPRRTTLERGILAHLEAGKHFRCKAGWVEL